MIRACELSFTCEVFDLAAYLLQALKECDPDLRIEAENLLEQLATGELDHNETFATCT